MDLPAEHEGAVKELVRGRGLAAQLRAMLRDGQLDSVDSVIDEISDSFDRAINELSSSSSSSSRFEPQHQIGNRRRENASSEKRFVTKPAEDGYIWMKYGQKKILGAKYPRNYYRCSQHKDQLCQATKQVQRTDDDPPMFQVNYIGRHSCSTLLHTSYLSDAGDSPTNNCWLSFETDQSAKSQWREWPSNFLSQNQESGNMIPDNTSVGTPMSQECSHYQPLDPSTARSPDARTFSFSETNIRNFSVMPSSLSNPQTSTNSYAESPMEFLPDDHTPFGSF